MDHISRAVERSRTPAQPGVLPPQPQGLEDMGDLDDGAPGAVPHVPPAREPSAAVSREHALEPAVAERERILPPGAGGPYGAPYKMLRTQVLKRMDKLGATVLAVLSPTEGAGKTLTAINLAIAIAAERTRTVVLVDLDLRNPSIHNRLGLEPELGIDTCLQFRRSIFDAAVRLAGYERLVVIPAQNAVEESSELMGEANAAAFQELRGNDPNRIVIVDLPPVLQADDALVFSRYAQAGLMVVDEGYTRRDDVSRAITLLHDMSIVGTVLNGSREPVDAPY